MADSTVAVQRAEVQFLMRPTVARISLAALGANIDVARSCAPNAKIAAVVKANAYGHGAEQCAKALQERADALAVASIDEALALRAWGISAPVLLLEGHFHPDELDIASQHGFWLMAHTAQQVEQIIRFHGKKSLTVWLKVDSGMHRLGIPPEHASAAYSALKNCPHVNSLPVLASHFASAEAAELDTTRQQIEVMDTLNAGIDAPISMANSAGILAHPASHGAWIRPGIMLYGCSPAGTLALNSQHSLSAVMTLESEVIAVRDIACGEGVGYGHKWKATAPSRIATVAIGYADGYPRSAPSGTPVIVAGQRAHLCGAVSMDMITVDITGLAGIEIGSKVELWGDQLSASEVARYAGSISYELLARMPSRVVRHYV